VTRSPRPIKDTSQGLLTEVTGLDDPPERLHGGERPEGFMELPTPRPLPALLQLAMPSTTRPLSRTRLPWAALEGGVLMEQEIGHFEACGSVRNSCLIRRLPGRPDLQRPQHVPDLCRRSEGTVLSVRVVAISARASVRTPPPRGARRVPATLRLRLPVRILRRGLFPGGGAND